MRSTSRTQRPTQATGAKRRAKLAGLWLAAMLAAAGCGAESSNAEDAGAADQETSTEAAEATTTTTSRGPGTLVVQLGDDADAAASSDETKRNHEVDVESLAFVADLYNATTTTTTTTVAPTTSTTAATTTASTAATSTTVQQPTTTSGSGGAPVTTTGGGGGGDVSIYQGVLGSIGLDDVMAPAVASPPAAVAGIMPLTGLPGTVPNRPAAVVKVDNGSRARPQTGLNSADIVIEEEVEGGITRFAAIFHSTETIVGPIRSGRTTDIGVLSGLGSPVLLYSGANQVTDDLILARSEIQNRSAARSSGYWRSSSRRAPSNMYSDTAPHWASASGGPPPPQFAYRAEGTPVGGTDVSSFKVSYRASKAAWTWDGSAWLRSQGGASHMTASGERVSAANVVVIEAEEVATGMVDSSGAQVPEFVFVGTGKATVFTAGKRIDGVWTKPTLRSVATLTTSDGAVIELTPGRTWVELIGAGSGLLG